MPKKPAHERNRCQQVTADGRRCQMPRMKDHPCFCYIHAQRQQQILNPKRVVAELLGPFQDLKTANSVNHALGSLFLLVAQNRIPPRSAATLAYIGQLILLTIRPLQTEIRDAWGYGRWGDTVRQVLWHALHTEAPGLLTQATIQASIPPPRKAEEEDVDEEEEDEADYEDEEDDETEQDEADEGEAGFEEEEEQEGEEDAVTSA
jgi:hypothetical protein